MPVGRRNAKITQQDQPLGRVGPLSAGVLLTRAAAKAGLGKGKEAEIKKKYVDQDKAYAKAYRKEQGDAVRAKVKGKTAAVAMPRKKSVRVATK